MAMGAVAAGTVAMFLVRECQKSQQNVHRKRQARYYYFRRRNKNAKKTQ